MYMSPEQLRGESLDRRTDIFSLGLVLYEMATGRRAFDGPTTSVIAASILHKEPVPPRAQRPELRPVLESILLKALEKDRDLRYQSAADLRADLKRAQREQLGAAKLVGTDSAAATIPGETVEHPARRTGRALLPPRCSSLWRSHSSCWPASLSWSGRRETRETKAYQGWEARLSPTCRFSR
jgi:serine/threonine protein kinase